MLFVAYVGRRNTEIRHVFFANTYPTIGLRGPSSNGTENLGKVHAKKRVFSSGILIDQTMGPPSDSD
jgi:hypothetical protein